MPVVITFELAEARRDEIRGILKSIGRSVPTSGILQVEATPENLEELLLAARAHCLSKDELYFMQQPSDLLMPFNLRNEAAAVSLILQRLAQNASPSSGQSSDPKTEALKQTLLQQHGAALWPEFGSGDVNLCGKDPPPALPAASGTPEADFHTWADAQGIAAAIEIASFGDLRGCAAKHDISPGTPILSIPRTALIYEDTIRETDLGRMLLAIPNVALDNVLILFTIIDRHEEDSAWVPFWRSLPRHFRTGLSFPPSLLPLLAGTAAELEIKRGQEHLRAQYEATKPLMEMLLTAYPAFLKQEWFEYENYLWATELFYSYAFEIEFPPSTTSKTVMVPFACHVNHSPWPHVVRYGRVDPVTSTLDYPAFRPCKQGQQVFISYGPVPNLKLLTYYGFVIPNNPHDVFSLTLQVPESDLSGQHTQALTELGLSLEHSLQKGPLAKKLLAALRVIVATEPEVTAILKGISDPLQGPINKENESQALHTLQQALQAVLAGISEPGTTVLSEQAQQHEETSGSGDEWLASRRCCLEYVVGQRSILNHALAECERLLVG